MSLQFKWWFILYFCLVWKDPKGSVSLMFKHNWQRLPLHFAEHTFLSSVYSLDLTKKLFKLLALRKETKGAGVKTLLVSGSAYKNYKFLRIKKLRLLKLGLLVNTNGTPFSFICCLSFSLTFSSDLKTLLLVHLLLSLDNPFC